MIFKCQYKFAYQVDCIELNLKCIHYNIKYKIIFLSLCQYTSQYQDWELFL